MENQLESEKGQTFCFARFIVETSVLMDVLLCFMLLFHRN